MGTDVERIIGGMQLLHEVWASLLDIAIASWLLEDQLSLAALAPIVVVLGKERVLFINMLTLMQLSMHRYNYQDLLA